MGENSMNPLERFHYTWRHPANRDARFRAIVRAALWQTHKRLGGKYWDVVLPGGRFVRGYAHLHTTALLVYAGLYDWNEMNFLLRYLRPGDNFLDVGGNVGVYSLLASSVLMERGEIHIFEPALESLTILEENLNLNALENTRIYPFAVGETEGNVHFTCGRESMNRLIDSDRKDTTEVHQVCLDDEVGDIPFAMGKMDIEGAELPALKGASRMLAAKSPPVWLLEFGDASRAFEYGPEDLITHLRAFGYGLAEYDPDENRILWSTEGWRGTANVLAIAEEQMAAVEQRLRSKGASF